MAVRSLCKGLVGEDIRHLVQKGLMVRVSSPKGEHPDIRMIQEDFTTNQAMEPVSIHRPGVAKESDAALFIRPTEVDNPTGYRTLKVQLPGQREGSAGRGSLDPFGLLGTHRLDKPIRASGQGGQVLVMKPVPHETLPSPVVTLDSGLEARFCGRDEDGYHSQLEAYPDDPSERIGVVMGALESRVVVELAVAWQANLTPVIQDTVLRPNGLNRASLGPGSHKPSVERDGIQDIDQRSILDAKVFDDIEGIDFGVAGDGLWKVPSEGWSGPSLTACSIEGSAAFEDTSNGPDRGDPAELGLVQFSVNSQGSILSEVTVDLQGSSQVQDLLFKVGRGSVHGACRTRGMGGEIDAIQTLRARPSEPVLNGGQTEAESPGHGPHGVPASHGLNDPPASLFNGLFWVMGRSPFQPVFEESIPSGGPPGDLRTLTLD